MVDPQVVARRVLALNESLRELERPSAADPAALASDRVLRAAVERWLQIAVEACIDVADHVIASEGWTPPATTRAAFATLAAFGRLLWQFVLGCVVLVAGALLMLSVTLVDVRREFTVLETIAIAGGLAIEMLVGPAVRAAALSAGRRR